MTASLRINKNVLAREVYRAALNPDGATWSKAGVYSWTAPAGVTSVTVECYGAGGGGGGSGANNLFGISGGGGGGGGYGKSTVPVTPGTSYSVVVGAGGAGGTSGAGASGADSEWDGGVVAGHGGGGGAVASGTGGAGGAGGTFAAASGANGANGATGLSSGAGTGGAAGGPAGGAGGAVGGDLSGPAADGSPYGGGGGGAIADSEPDQPGGDGADGAVILSWTGTSEPVYVAGCESPCSTYWLGRRVGTISGTPVYAYATKCCAYPATDIGGTPLTVGFHEQSTYPPGISDYLTVVLSGNNCPVLGADHCVVGEAFYGTAMAWAPSGFGWAGTIAGITVYIWVDASCAHPIRFWIESACGISSVAAAQDSCGSCHPSSPCAYVSVDCNFPLRGSVGYSNLGSCCPGAVTDCSSTGSFTIKGYCRPYGLGRYVEAPVFPVGTPTRGGPTPPSPPRGTFTEGPDCPCPPAAFCPKLAPPCCDLVEACNCPTLTGTISNGAGTLTCFNGASGSLPCGSLVGSLRTWSGTISFSSCGGITSFSASVQCDGSTGQWSASLSAGAGCTFSGGTVQSVDCANRTVHITGMTGSGLTCSGSSLDFTITW